MNSTRTSQAWLEAAESVHSCLFGVMAITPDCWSVLWGFKSHRMFMILCIFCHLISWIRCIFCCKIRKPQLYTYWLFKITLFWKNDSSQTQIQVQTRVKEIFHFFWTNQQKDGIKPFYEPSVKSVRIDAIGTFWQVTNRKLFHTTWIIIKSEGIYIFIRILLVSWPETKK